jgi:HD-GYP domain-containing protein (c-di-GMP phosphodiesterase class II)
MCLRARTVPDDAVALEWDQVGEVVDELATALVNSRIYAAEHPRVRSSAAAAHAGIAALTRRSTLRLSVADDLLVLDGTPLVGASMTATRLIHGLERFGAGGLEVDREASVDDILALLRGIGSRPEPGHDWERVNRELEARTHRTVRLLPPFVRDGAPARRERLALRTPLRFYQSCIDMLQDVTVAVCHGGRIDFGPVREHVEAVLRRLEGSEGAILNLAREDQYDAFTFGHSVRVGVLAMNFARTLTRDHGMLIRIGTAALLHDCGKARIPFEILHSRKTLDEDERREMGKHPQFGAEILLDHREADPLSIAAAFGHHRGCAAPAPDTEPMGRSLLVTEIVKICDVYEALTAARPYKLPMTPIRAYRVMVGMQDHLDRDLLRRFVAVNGIYPTGLRVRLSTGEQARVQAQTEDLSTPRVEILTDRDGCELHEEDRQVVDLRDPDAGPPRVIVEVVDVSAVSGRARRPEPPGDGPFATAGAARG